MALTMGDIRATLGLSKDATTAELFAEVDRRLDARRDRLVAAAVADGRLLEQSAPAWRAELDRGGVAAEKTLASFASVGVTSASRPEDRPEVLIPSVV